MLSKISRSRFITNKITFRKNAALEKPIFSDLNALYGRVTKRVQIADMYLDLIYNADKMMLFDRLKIVNALDSNHFSDLAYTMFSNRQYACLLFLWVKWYSVMIIIIWLIYRQNENMGIGIANVFRDRLRNEPKKTDVRFSDIIGIEEFKEELEDIVRYMSNREKFLKSGATIPKGVLLIGPPGCGKTQLARAVAGEANLPFYSVTASEFVQPFVGEGPRTIKKLFDKAKTHKKGAIIFIDEIDSLMSRNELITVSNSNLNQLLTEMDGFESSDNILIIAATNHEKALDNALTRTGRFDLKIHIRLPNFENRKKILDYYLKKVKYDAGLDRDVVARKTVNFSPAEIKNLVNIAVMQAVKEKKQVADFKDFNFAFERIKLGIKSKQHMFDPKTRNAAALREATKAVLSITEPSLPEVDKITLSFYGETQLGKSILVERSDVTNYTKKDLLLRLELMLAPKASEELYIDSEERSSLVLSDLENARSLATRFVTEFAMTEEFSLVSMEKRNLSNDQRFAVEQKVEEVLNETYNVVKDKIRKHQGMIFKVKDALIEKEELDRYELKRVLDIASIGFVSALR